MSAPKNVLLGFLFLKLFSFDSAGKMVLGTRVSHLHSSTHSMAKIKKAKRKYWPLKGYGRERKALENIPCLFEAAS